jgi:hypothetical protein
VRRPGVHLLSRPPGTAQPLRSSLPRSSTNSGASSLAERGCLELSGQGPVHVKAPTTRAFIREAQRTVRRQGEVLRQWRMLETLRHDGTVPRSLAVWNGSTPGAPVRRPFIGPARSRHRWPLPPYQGHCVLGGRVGWGGAGTLEPGLAGGILAALTCGFEVRHTGSG